MKYPYSIFLLIGFISCVEIVPCSATAERKYQITDREDSLNAVKTIKGFHKWFKMNYKKSSGFRLVGTDKLGYYFVDQKVCEKYLKHLKSSDFISDTYVHHWRKYFSEKEQHFKDNPQNEGPPEGFDYDLVSGTQEPELFYNPSGILKFVLVKAEKFKLVVKSSDIWEHQFTLSKSGGKWKIDAIEMLGYPNE